MSAATISTALGWLTCLYAYNAHVELLPRKPHVELCYSPYDCREDVWEIWLLAGEWGLVSGSSKGRRCFHSHRRTHLISGAMACSKDHMSSNAVNAVQVTILDAQCSSIL